MRTAMFKKRSLLVAGIGLFVIIFAVSCTGNPENDEKQRDKREIQHKSKLKDASDMSAWWNGQLNNAPSHTTYPYLAKLSKSDVEIIYSYYNKEFINSNYNGSNRYNSTEKRLAEEFNTHYKTFYEANVYIGSDYIPFLDKITKEYFFVHNDSIIPDYYGSIAHTAFVGDYTFCCTLKLKTCNDSSDIDGQVYKHIKYLKQTLPDKISGFKIFDTTYECEKTGTEGSLDIGYIWRRKDDVLLRKNRGAGLYGGHRLPQENEYWYEPSWNNKQRLKNDSKKLHEVLAKLR